METLQSDITRNGEAIKLLDGVETLSVPAILKDRGGRVRWCLKSNTDEANLAIGVDNVQGLFLNHFPSFSLSYPINERGLIINELRDEARKFILENIGTASKFKEICGSSPLSINTAPYFGGSLYIILERSFVQWGIIFEFKRVDATTGIYTDSNGDNYLPENRIRQLYGLKGDKPLARRLAGVAIIDGIAADNHITSLYRQVDVKARLEPLSNLPAVDGSTERYLDSGNRNWVTLNFFRRKYGIGSKTLENYLDDVPYINGKDRSNREATLYDELTLEAKLEEFVSLPRVQPQTSNFIDNFGKKWTLAKELRRKYGDRIIKLLHAVTNMKGRDGIGQVTLLYDEVELLELFPDLDDSSKSMVSAEEADRIMAEEMGWK